MSEFSTHTMVFRSQKRSLDLFVSNYEQLPFNSNDELELAKRNVKAFDLYGPIARAAVKRQRAGSPTENGITTAGSSVRKPASSNAVALISTRHQNSCGNGSSMSQPNSELSLLLPSPSLATGNNENENVNSSVMALTAQKRKLAAPVSLKPNWHAPWKLYRVISGHLGWVRCVAVEPANQWFATGANDRVIKIWDLATGQLKVSLTGHVSTVRGLSVSARHPYLFSAGEDKQVKCWDLECNKVVRHYHGHLSAVHALDLHPSIDVLVTAGRDSTVRVWDMRTKANVLTLTGHTSTVSSVICQSADPQIVSGSHDTTVRLWDLTAGATFCTLTNHKKSVRSVVFHPTLNQFASASPDTIKKWMCPEGRFIQTFNGHNAILNTLAVNDRGVLVSGADNGTVHLWDWKTGHNFQRIQSAVQPGSMDSEAGIFHLCFDRSGRRLISAEADKTIKIYREDETATEETHPVNWRPEVQRKKRF